MKLGGHFECLFVALSSKMYEEYRSLFLGIVSKETKITEKNVTRPLDMTQLGAVYELVHSPF